MKLLNTLTLPALRALPFSVQVMTPGLYHYYMTELAFYWSLMFSQFTDIKRKVRGTSLINAQ